MHKHKSLVNYLMFGELGMDSGVERFVSLNILWLSFGKYVELDNPCGNLSSGREHLGSFLGKYLVVFWFFFSCSLFLLYFLSLIFFLRG